MFTTSRVLFSQKNLCTSYYNAEYVFNKENIQRTVANFSKINFPIRTKNKKTDKKVVKAAVFIPVCEIDGQVAILYTLRAANLKSHRGQVSFPGGKCDDYDKSVEETAVRETVEELGIDVNRIDVWGKGNWLSTKYGTYVTPVIGCIKGNLVINELKTNPTEVEEVFTMNLEDLCNPNNFKYTQFRLLIAKAPSSTPVFLGGQHRIWGLTGFLTHMFLKSLLPMEAYSHPLIFVPPVEFGRPVVDE